MLTSADIMRMRGITEEDMVQARRRTQGLIAAAVPDSKNKRQRSAGNDSSSRPSTALPVSKIKFISCASKNAHTVQGAIDSKSASEGDGDEKDAERSDDCRKRQQRR